jgi:hypothetical protein
VTTPPYNTQRWASLQVRLEAAAAALPGMVDVTRQASDEARSARHDALRLTPIPWAQNAPLAGLVEALEAEHGRVLADPKHNPAHEFQARSALAAARRAVAAEARAAALRAQLDRAHAEIAPVRQLAEACRKWIGTDSFMQLGSPQ